MHEDSIMFKKMISQSLDLVNDVDKEPSSPVDFEVINELKLDEVGRQDAAYTRTRVGPGSPLDPGLRPGEQEGWGLFRGRCFPTMRRRLVHSGCRNSSPCGIPDDRSGQQ
jgi:hypothetical protein